MGPHTLPCSLLLLLSFLYSVNGLGEVIYAVNAGGEAHIDVYGVRYEKDPLTGKVGTASDFGKQLVIGRVPPGDQVLYQTERYHHSTFGYEIPLKGDGEYVLVLKFSEVYFNAPDQKVFDVVMNGELTVVPALDIFLRVGRGVAHDEYVPFTVAGNTLVVGGQESPLRGNKVKVEFVKGYKDNPKVNAIFVIKGRLDDVPKLPPLPREEELDNEVEEPRQSATLQNTNTNQNSKQQQSAKRRPSGPRTPDPYAADDTSSMLPVFVAIGAAIPILFCLCKL
ncbi:malectin-A-like isoform X1 [Portunus trituberculatus]|uniref:malectin-A-like isoform X1 n=1 Tax=Portunus trituberculatus TaxID=210409 RepID=UPI001E1CEA6E|nr:malectin-A-like isoform X1 [Portunus trituberculatus]